MKLLTAKVQNFGSYKELNFSFGNQGLSLISGPTGSGKSTIQDIAPWILFGVTAKDGNVDDIKSWTAQDKVTSGVLLLEVQGVLIRVIRVRGKTTQNDLHWIENDTVYRGKDTSETQKLLNQRLGIDLFTYTLGAYYNEFSPTSQFFTSKASDRRELFESLANLSLPTLLIDRISNVKKETRKAYTEILERYNKTLGRLEYLEKTQRDSKKDVERWAETQKRAIEDLQVRSKRFKEEIQSKIEALETKRDMFELNKSKDIEKLNKDIVVLDKILANNTSQCETCGEPNKKYTETAFKKERTSNQLDRVLSQVNLFIKDIDVEKSKENPYPIRLLEEQARENPFMKQSVDFEELKVLESTNLTYIKLELQVIDHKLISLDQLRKITDKLRITLCKNTVSMIEAEVNNNLSQHFDSELKVKFELQDGDKLETIIWKSGYESSYKQLSKGQRGLLKLSFSVAVMKSVANKIGIHFNTLFFDEALDGLDDDLKTRSYDLFNSLSKNHESIFVIDHNEGLKTMFEKRFSVSINSDISTIEEL